MMFEYQRMTHPQRLPHSDATETSTKTSFLEIYDTTP
jgi:hypothetical protein